MHFFRGFIVEKLPSNYPVEQFYSGQVATFLTLTGADTKNQRVCSDILPAWNK